MKKTIKIRPTLKDIARLADVSVSTVSIVLSDKSIERRISKEVDERVRAVAQEQDYSPNLLMHSLRRGRTHVAAFFNGWETRTSGDLYMERLSTAVELAAGSAGYDLLVHCNFRLTPDENYRRLTGGFTDGLIFVGPTVDVPVLDLLRSSRLPTVVLGHADPKNVLSSVSDDMPGGIKALVKHLFESGHKRFAAIGGCWQDAGLRITQLRHEVESYGLDIPDNLILQSSPDGQVMEAALKHIFDSPGAPTAIFCWHDFVGYRILEALDNIGVKVPEQVSVIGYDGIPWPSLTSHVLASVSVDMTLIANEALMLLDRLINGVEDGVSQIYVPSTIIPGTTLAPAS